MEVLMTTLIEKNAHLQNESKFQDSLAQRVKSIAFSAITPSEAVSLSAMNDIDLVLRLYVKLLENNSSISNREKRKLERRAKAEKSFFEDLEKLGGVMKPQDVANLLNVKRQTVNNRFKANRLIAIKKGGEYLYPHFQFFKDGMLPYFEDINQLLPEELDAVGRISFFISNLNDKQGENKSPLDLLKKDDLREEDISRIKRSAKLQLSHISK